MFRVYMTKDKLVDVFIDESDALDNHSNWFKVLSAQPEISLDEYEEGEEENMDNPLFVIRKNNANLHFAQDDAINEITNGDYEQVLEHNPCGAYILDVSPEVAKSIQDGYGVICESTSSQLKETFLITPDFPIDRAKNGKTWERFPVKKVPSNTLIIQDRFFCRSDRGESIQDTYDNFEKIIRALLPMSFSSTYHLIVIFDDTRIEARDSVMFNDIAERFNDLKNLLENERGYSILLEVLSVPDHSYNYDLTHNRRILSNYYWIEAPHKLKAFRGVTNLSNQTLTCKFLYMTLNMPFNFLNEEEIPDSHEENHDKWINDFKGLVVASRFSGQYSPYNSNRRFPPVVYDFSVNGMPEPPSKIKNRILS